MIIPASSWDVDVGALVEAIPTVLSWISSRSVLIIVSVPWTVRLPGIVTVFPEPPFVKSSVLRDAEPTVPSAIVLSDIAYQISLVDGVASIVPPDHNNPNKDIVCIENKHLVSSEYSGNIYDMSSASKDGVVYPSLDPSIFEVKFPDSDIEGRVVGDF